MHIVSWNVNGLRAAAKKGFSDWLHAWDDAIVGLQEVRALPEQLPAELREPDAWHPHFVAAEKKGYSGVALYARRPPQHVETALGNPEFDSEGRVQIATFGQMVLANVYFPNGSGKNRDNSRIPFKLDFYRALYDRLERFRAEGRPVLVMGDFNTAHQDIDLARPGSNRNTSGFCAEEREELDRWLRHGYCDTWRTFEPEGGRYTWWSNRPGVREKNVGWRIDYVLASDAAMPYVRSATIHDDVLGSDHCPVSVEVDDRIFG